MKKLIWCECVADLADGRAGISSWADLWVGEHGELYISMGGGWTYYDCMEGIPDGYFLMRGNIGPLLRHWIDTNGSHFPPLEVMTGEFVAVSEFEQVVDYDMFRTEWI